MLGRARRRAVELLDGHVATFERFGYRAVERGPLEACLERAGSKPGLRVRMAQQGRVFGGAFALELSTSDPVLPCTRGLQARGRGLVTLRGVAFKPRPHDAAGARLARRLEDDDGLRATLASVHFERVRIDPDGRPVIRHMGGSVVWALFPPIVRPVPLVDEQARAAVAALEAFASAGR